jgi:putative endonuclease
MCDKIYTVYIMASAKNGTLYVGSSSGLAGRVWQHKNKFSEKSFTAEYSVKDLVYYEVLDTAEAMVNRERLLKKYMRIWKINLIEKDNPLWLDLYGDLAC